MQKDDPIWNIIVEEARQASIEEPVLADFLKPQCWISLIWTRR